MKTTIFVPVWAIKASFNAHGNDKAYWKEFAKQHATSHNYYSNLRSVTKNWVDESVYRVGKSCQQSIYALLSHLDLAQCIRLKEEARDVYDGLVAWKSSQLIPTVPYQPEVSTETREQMREIERRIQVLEEWKERKDFDTIQGKKAFLFFNSKK